MRFVEDGCFHQMRQGKFADWRITYSHYFPYHDPPKTGALKTERCRVEQIRRDQRWYPDRRGTVSAFQWVDREIMHDQGGRSNAIRVRPEIERWWNLSLQNPFEHNP